MNRGTARRGMTRHFQIQSTLYGIQLSWGSCEIREEALFEARWILATFPETSRVAIDEITVYEFSRKGFIDGQAASGWKQAYRRFRARLEGIA